MAPVVVLAITLAASARAAPTEAELAQARQSFLDGVSAQDHGRYAEALAAYLQASRVASSPQLLFNMATCEEQLGRLLSARTDYESAVSAARARHDDEAEQEASARLTEVAARVPHLTVHVPADLSDLTATVDGESVTLEALAHFELDPGVHRLKVRSPSRPREFEASFDLAVGAERVFDVDLGPLPVVAPPPPPSPTARSVPSYLPAFIASGVTVAAGVGAIASGVLGHSARADYLSLNATPTEDNRARREELRSMGQSLYVANAVLVGVTAVALGVAVYFLVRPPGRSLPSLATSNITF